MTIVLKNYIYILSLSVFNKNVVDGDWKSVYDSQHLVENGKNNS